MLFDDFRNLFRFPIKVLSAATRAKRFSRWAAIHIYFCIVQNSFMKRLSTLGLLLLAATGLHAQITLTNTGYTNAGTDTLSVLLTGSGPSMLDSLGTPASNKSWDLGLVPSNGLTFYDKNQFPNPPFPTADYAHVATYNFSSALSYATNMFIKMDNSGILRLGQNKFNRESISIGAFTGNTNDSLIFPAQTIAHTATATELAFPATMGSNWTSSYGANTQFNLTLTAYGLNNTPGERRSFFTYKDSVVGWGRMRVRNFRNNQLSAWIPVLQVREYVVTRDSFYLGGTQAPATLLFAFGLSQGQLTNTYRMKYYRAGEQYPLVQAEYDDASFAGTPTQAEANMMRLPNAAAVTSVAGLDAVRVFPNPVQNGVLHIEGYANAGVVQYALFTVTGQVLQAGELPASGALTLPAGLSAGTYQLRLFSGTATAVHPVLVP